MTQILVIEDDEWMAEVELAALKNTGFELKLAANCYEAIDMIDQQLPDLIILDLLLAGSTAFSLLNELQSHDDTASIPVILCTNIADGLDIKQLKAYGVRRIINKLTMSSDDISAAVKAML